MVLAWITTVLSLWMAPVASFAEEEAQLATCASAAVGPQLDEAFPEGSPWVVASEPAEGEGEEEVDAPRRAGWQFADRGPARLHPVGLLAALVETTVAPVSTAQVVPAARAQGAPGARAPPQA